MIKYFSNKVDWLSVRRNVIKWVEENLDSNAFLHGKASREFADRIKNFIGSKYCILTKSGTQALAVALKSCGVGQGDYVITTPFTFIATINAIKLVGAEPIFVDIKEDTFNIDENKIEEKITDKVKAIMPVDIFGNPCNYDAILAIAKKHNLKVIDDMCQAMTAEYNGKKLGSFCDASCVSFYPTKPFGGFGEGGAIFTNDDEIYKMANSYLDHGSDGNANCVIDGTNGAFDMIHGVFLNEKAKMMLPQVLKKRNELAQIYHQMEGVTWQKQEPNAVSAWCRMQGAFDCEENFELAKTIFEFDDCYSRDICDNTLYAQYREENPVSAKIAHTYVSFPIYTYLAVKNLKDAVEKFNSLRKK